MASAPLVSIIMPVYNTAAYVGQAIQSVLDQRFTDWELIIVDDGSSDGSEAVIRNYTDPRIRFERHTPNRGVSPTLNRALELCRGTFVARHDSDDLSLPERLEQQMAYLQADPACGIIGTYATTIDPEGAVVGAIEHHPVTDAGIRFASFFDSPFVSSTVIFRRELLAFTGGFDNDPARPVWDDYDMWSRLLRHTVAANLPRHLLLYRMLRTGLTGTTAHAKAMVREQRRRNIAAALPKTDPSIVDLVAGIGFTHQRCSAGELRQVLQLLYALIAFCKPVDEEHRNLIVQARQKAMDFHVVERTGALSKAVDKATKWAVIATTPTPT